jgi:D-alanyl-D-alanine carboxypeptidase (penicillin-binding protein 5/6)
MMKRKNSILGCLGLVLALGLVVAPAATQKSTKSSSKTAPAKKAPYPGIARNPYLGAIVVDAATGRVLFEDQADAKGYPASVQKLMDLLIILEKLRQGHLSLTDPVPVSARAALTGGSQVWLAEKECFSVEDMLYALMVQSANDAAVALAEKVAGSTEAFVGLMNQRARQLGMNSTVFTSVHGLPPSKGQQHDVSTARDFALLCRELLKYPEALRYTSTRERPFRPNAGNKTVIMRTHNHLLNSLDGCDGLKTGYFYLAGYSIAVTAARNGQRVIVMVLDSVDRKTRDAKAAELVAKGFAALAAAPATPAVAVPAASSPKPAPAKPAPR